MVAEGTTVFTSANGFVMVEACGVVAQLTQLRRLRLECPSILADARLRRLSALGSLTSLEVVGGGQRWGHTGSWLAALAVAGVPLRQLRMRSRLQAGQPLLRPPQQLCSPHFPGLLT
jgi:hypothetical protein